jgi:hypothetical protein
VKLWRLANGGRVNIQLTDGDIPSADLRLYTWPRRFL